METGVTIEMRKIVARTVPLFGFEGTYLFVKT
jgi:hypothetical protein